MKDSELIEKAFAAREKAYAPYSDYLCGAALLSKDGQVFTGCNVENAAFSPSNCAERTAFFKAVSEGVNEFEVIAVVGGFRNTKAGEFAYTFPCGVCRQVMLEFCDADHFRIITATSVDDITSKTLGELVPERWPSKSFVSNTSEPRL